MPPRFGSVCVLRSADHDHEHRGHNRHAPMPASPVPAAASARGFQPLASTAGARLARVAVAIAVLWAAVAWALLS